MDLEQLKRDILSLAPHAEQISLFVVLVEKLIVENPQGLPPSRRGEFYMNRLRDKVMEATDCE